MASPLSRLRRFEHQTIREVVLRAVLPRGWDQVASVDAIDHKHFELPLNLYDPLRNMDHQRGQLGIVTIENGTHWPSVGAIQSAEGHLIKETFPDQESLLYSIKNRHLQRFPRILEHHTASTLGSVYRNYYHRWADSISRIYALHHPVCAELSPIVVYVDSRFSKDEILLINGLLPSYAKLQVLPQPSRIVSPRTIHLPFLSSDRVDYSQWFKASLGFIPYECLNWLRNSVFRILQINPSPPHRKLFISRRNASVRRLLNEDQVADYATKQGFSVVCLEALPLRSQIQMFAEAKVVVAQHGAGLTNLLFSRGCSVVEILSDCDRQLYFSLLSKSLGLRHIQLCLDGRNKNDDVTLHIETLDSAIRSLSAV